MGPAGDLGWSRGRPAPLRGNRGRRHRLDRCRWMGLTDCVRLNEAGAAIADPFCYRDPRNIAAEQAVHERIDVHHLYALTGLQRLRFNTIYQLYADQLAGIPAAMPWINLPEYFLYRLGGRRVAEYTNATHTGLVSVTHKTWCAEVFDTVGLDPAAAPALVAPGTDVGALRGRLAELPAFRDTRLIAPACHDTASAIAGIPGPTEDSGYISSAPGLWSVRWWIGPAIRRPRSRKTSPTRAPSPGKYASTRT